jgi:hypothetical protein
MSSRLYVPLVAMSLVLVLTSLDIGAQVQAPATRLPVTPAPLPPLAPPQACSADRGVPLSLYSALPGLAGRDLSGWVSWSDRMTNETCQSTCANLNFAYAGTQSGAFCFCGDSHGSYGSSTGCNSRCVGNLIENCGGSLANNVWGVSYVPPSAPPAPPNGGQCVFDVSGVRYHHHEVQTWVVAGRIGDPMTTATYTMNWSVTAEGSYHEVNPDSSLGVRNWTVSGAAQVPYRAQVIADGSLLFSPQGSAAGQVTDTQTKYVDGRAQTPTTAVGSWGMIQTPELKILPPLGPNITGMQSFASQTYAAPHTASGGVVTAMANCTWNVIR